MSTESRCQRRMSRLLTIRLALSLFLSFSLVLWGSIGFASNIPNAALASGPDTDVLDMQGDWLLTFGSELGARSDSPGCHVPVGFLWENLKVHFDLTGPGSFGGLKFDGYYTAYRG